jgi:hypothetical protein
MSRSRTPFQTIRSEGGLLPTDLLQRVAQRDKGLDGLSDKDYHLADLPLNEEIVRSWNRLVGAWASFREARAALPEKDPGTTVTRERWLLVLFDELSYGRLQTARAVEIDGKPYPVSHAWGSVPIHLVGCNVALDKRTAGVAGAATHSPHGLCQELLSRSEERLWGFVSNGLQLRILRDNSALTRQAYVEFDLEQMLDSEAYSDFVLLWLLCHQSRVEGERPHECWLERWSQEAQKQGTRALDNMRDGVERAIVALGVGFVAHVANGSLRDGLRAAELSTQEYYRQLLRLVYRLLFLFVAEDRDVLLSPDASVEARERYESWYSTQHLRRLAERRRGTKHGDLYEALKLVMGMLGDDSGCPELGLPPLGSFLWSSQALPHLEAAQLANADLLEAVRALATVRDGRVLRAVDYRNLGAEELGSVYESLLELHPEVNADAGHFALTTAAGNERKTTGSYYTPSSLISVLLDSALDPVLDEAAAKGEEAVLDLKVCDPACGSGHFLVAAAHRIAKRLATLRTGDEEASPEATRVALRDVVSRCLYGVDVNPMAVELCKVSLWVEALDPGRPLSFLDSHIRCGNSLVGVTVALVNGGIPDGAFTALDGDTNSAATSLRQQNKVEREGQLTFEDATSVETSGLEAEAAALEAVADDSVAAIRDKETRLAQLEASEAFEQAQMAADAWCAAFIHAKQQGLPRITTGVVQSLASDGCVPVDVRKAVLGLASDYRFFHWEIEFPQIFGVEPGGFDVVVGNPPWGRVKLQEKPYWASRAPEITAAPNKAARTRLLDRLAEDEPTVYAEYKAELRRYEALSLFFHESAVFPLTGVGDVNTYSLFSELSRRILRSGGRAGLIVQQGIATDDTTKDFFRDLVTSSSLVAVYGFENEEKLFPGVHNQTKFCIFVVASPGTGPEEVELSFFNRQAATVFDEDRLFYLRGIDFEAINPNTSTCPVFRSSADARIIRAMHERFPVLVREGAQASNPWEIEFQSMFHMANDSGLFRTADELEADGWKRQREIFSRGDERYLPLLEGKMIHLWNPRYGTYEGQTRPQANKGVIPVVDESRLADPDFAPRPKYWVAEADVAASWAGAHDWALAFRDIGPLERTFLVTVVPRTAVGHKLPLIHLPATASCAAPLFISVASSFLADYAMRQRTPKGGMSFFIVKQLAIPRPTEFDETALWDGDQSLGEWFKSRAVELTHTAWLTRSFARDSGFQEAPFQWIPKRRFDLQCELDSAVFHVYGLSRGDVEHVMDSFRLVRDSDEDEHGEYRTKRLILEIYDELAEAIATGRPYQTRLDPPPGDPRIAHPAGEEAVR